jgi:uncharacterized protein YbcI
VSEESTSPSASERDAQGTEHGAALAAISRRFVGLLKEYYGKGPTTVRTHHWGELVVVLMGGGYTQAERTLIEEGRGKTVMELRAELQTVMRPRFRQVIEEELRRDVVAFMSTAHHDPDFNVELFILTAREDAIAPAEPDDETIVASDG